MGQRQQKREEAGLQRLLQQGEDRSREHMMKAAALARCPVQQPPEALVGRLQEQGFQEYGHEKLRARQDAGATPEAAKTDAPVEAISSTLSNPQLFDKTVAQFQKQNPFKAKLQGAAPKKYETFCRNRTADLYATFFGLINSFPDYSESKFTPSFTACVPFPGRKDLRPVEGMARGGNVPHGLIRYEYKGDLIEECRKDGKEHGLRVVVVQTGHIWIRLHSEGNRLAQVALNADYSVSPAETKDDGGLKLLKSHLHLIQGCFEAKEKA